MSRTNQAEFTRAPSSVWVAAPRPLEELEGGVDSVSQRIASGRAFLKVVAYPWGVEFDVRDVEEAP